MAETKETAARALRKTRKGTVVNRSGDKTIRVQVTRRFRHPVYGKVVNQTSKFLVHDEKNEAKAGDVVRIMETRPLSKTKFWRLVEIVEAAAAE